MPILVLWARAEMEGIKRFTVPPDHVWELDIKEPTGSDVRHGVQVDPDEELEVPDASHHSTANCIIKFKGAHAAGHMKMVKLPILRSQTSDDQEMVPIAAFECRGLEPVKWTPTGPYIVESEGGVVYEDVGFKDNEDWCEYDEKNGISMVLGRAVQHEFRTYRGPH